MTKLIEAQRLTSSLLVHFSHASDAANRAVMAVTDDESTAAAVEAREQAAVIDGDIQTLQPVLIALSFTSELRQLDAFRETFGEYRALDEEILQLAVENTNLKAQRLLFGPSRDAQLAFGAAIAKSGAGDALATKGTAALLDVEVVQARHISEADDAAMSRMEAEISASLETADRILASLKRTTPAAKLAADALAQFKDTNAQIIGLSRRNTNVRSVEMSLGRKRAMAVACIQQLRALETALASHDFSATR